MSQITVVSFDRVKRSRRRGHSSEVIAKGVSYLEVIDTIRAALADSETRHAATLDLLRAADAREILHVLEARPPEVPAVAVAAHWQARTAELESQHTVDLASRDQLILQ